MVCLFLIIFIGKDCIKVIILLKLVIGSIRCFHYKDSGTKSVQAA